MERMHLKWSIIKKMIDVNYICYDFRRDAACEHTHKKTLHVILKLPWPLIIFINHFCNLIEKCTRSFKAYHYIDTNGGLQFSHWRLLSKCTFFKSFPKETNRSWILKCEFWFDLLNPLGVSIFQIHSQFSYFR